MKLIVGLGNPGKEYANSRHNAGWNVIDTLVKDLQLDEPKKEPKFKAMVSTGVLNDEKIILAKPTTYMNLSGESVIALMNFYKVPHEDLWVIYDDIDLPLGQIRIRKDGGAGTHNGMKSIVECLGVKTFPRLRIGTESRGLTAPKEQDTASFVLTPFTKEETKTIKEVFEKASKAIILSIGQNLDLAMNKYNV
jgi:PTH1 family peptidyl-tRNA hydrolase